MKIRKNSRRDEPDRKNKQGIFHITQFKINEEIPIKNFLVFTFTKKNTSNNLFSIVTLDSLISKAGLNTVSQKTKKSSLLQLFAV